MVRPLMVVSSAWALESETAFAANPPSFYIALEKDSPIDDGYAYTIIGGVGTAEYYAKTVGATLIEGSSPGI